MINTRAAAALVPASANRTAVTASPSRFGLPDLCDTGSQTGDTGTCLHNLQRDVGRLRECRGNTTPAPCGSASEVPRDADMTPFVGLGVGLAEHSCPIAESLGGAHEIRRIGQLPRG